MESFFKYWDYFVYLPVVFHLMLGVAFSYADRFYATDGESAKDNDIQNVIRNLYVWHFLSWVIISIYLCFLVDVEIGGMFFLFGLSLGGVLEDKILNSELSKNILSQYKMIEVALTLSIVLLVCLWFFK